MSTPHPRMREYEIGVMSIFTCTFVASLRLQSSLVGESVTGGFLLQEDQDNMYK